MYAGTVALALTLGTTSALAVLPVMTEPSEEPVIIESDALSYIPEKQLVLAVGRVEITQTGRILMAQELAYDQVTNTVIARGDVSLMEPDGNVYFADEVELKDDMKQGVIQHFNARLKDGSLLAASTARRLSAEVIQLEKAVFTPCKICEHGKAKTPTWQIKADKVKLDDNKERVSYRNATMEYYGVPILYTPYLSHAAPGAERKSGFLMPSYSTISTLGVTAKVPYYYNIAPNMDATITPFLTSKEGPVMIGEYRHLTETGGYELRGSITNPEERDDQGFRTNNGRDLRGHVEGFGEFDLKDDWVWGFNGKRSTDDTYLQRYKFGNEDLLTSRAYLNRLTGRNYITADTLTFQGLNANDDPDTTPLVLPLVSTHHETAPGWRSSRFLLDSNLMAISRGEGVESRRASVRGGWKIPYVTSNGHSFEFRSTLRADGYHVADVPDPLDPLRDEDGTVGRVIPEAQLDWSLPLVKYQESSHIFLEPVANFIISPYGGNPSKIPNEDSQDVELSDVNLFSASHFTGLDRVEGGPRTNYGMRGGIYGKDGSLNFLLGQHYGLKEDEQFREESGLSDNFSDYVGRVSVNNNKNMEFSYRFRIDHENFDSHRNEFDASLDFSPLRLSGAYVLLNEDIPSRPELDREEVAASVAYDLTPEWTASGYARRDLSDDGGLITAGSGLVFHNECLTVSGQFGREFIRDRDIEPSTFFMLEIGFKNLN